ncbi:hypothetical protein KDN24_06830 [Bacillus sp. Bva_UNVM-123]|uniref:hypothetical protein n=1 Tax=Bacillus sp. Bva_UNVM-123 TaxID=2829798 RepID=UPI00391F6C65
MDYKWHKADELKELIGKEVWILASHRINSRVRLMVNGMAFKVLGVSVDKNSLLLEPLPDEFKNKLIELPISMSGIEWGIEEVIN